MIGQKTVLIVSFVSSLYLCIGGIGDIVLTRKKEEARKLPQELVQDIEGTWQYNPSVARVSKEIRKLYAFYPMYTWNSTLSYIITLMAFGVLGSVIRLLLSYVNSGQGFAPAADTWIWIVLGAMVGIVVLIVDEAVLPEFKEQSGNDKFFYSFAFLNGLFTQEFFKKLSDAFAKKNTGGG